MTEGACDHHGRTSESCWDLGGYACWSLLSHNKNHRSTKDRTMNDRLSRESPRTEKRGRFLFHGVIATMRGCVASSSRGGLNAGHHHLVLRDAAPPRRTALLAVLAVLAVGRILRPSLGLLSQKARDPPETAAAPPRGSPHWWTDAEAERNAQKLEWRREVVREQCRTGTGTSSEAKLWRDELRSADTLPIQTMSTAQSDSTNTTRPRACRLAFFDLGANVGDSLGKFISVGIPSCDEGDGRNSNGGPGASDAPPPPTDFASHTDATNRLVRWAAQQLAEMGPTLEGKVLRPEHYCYFGVEGNPVFTDRLRRLQEGILRTQPRPVRWAQFFTETVAAAADGPTVLYLDTQNEARNYWGSSLLHSHKDVQASANADGQVYQAQVNGITLTTLLRDRVVPEHGSHVLIKMDIEGSEYGLLNEARDSGILCELTEKAIRVDLMVEVHSKKVVGPLDDMERFRKEVKRDLEHWCGVNLHLTMEAD